jgi:hypothetical protein
VEDVVQHDVWSPRVFGYEYLVMFQAFVNEVFRNMLGWQVTSPMFEQSWNASWTITCVVGVLSQRQGNPLQLYPRKCPLQRGIMMSAIGGS